MNKARMLSVVTVPLCVVGLCHPLKSETHNQTTDKLPALSTPAAADPDDLWQRETLTNGFGSLNDSLADEGNKMSPRLQYIANPGGTGVVSDAVVVAVRS